MATTSIYDGLNAKVKSMKGRLLSRDDYYILAQKKTVEEVGAKLKEYSSYEPIISTIDDSNMRRGTIEQKILLSLADDFSRIYKFIYDFKLKKFFSGFFLINEIKVIKQLLSVLNDNKQITYSESELQKLINLNHDIDIPKILTSKTIAELIENLKGSLIYDILSIGYSESESLFDLEMKLDVYYYMNIWKLQKRYLDKKNKKVMSQINGTEIDLRNILWIYRLKSYYQINANEIYSYLIPISFRLGTQRLSQMVESNSKESLLNEIKLSPYANVFEEETNIERKHYLTMNKAYSRCERQTPDSLAPTIGYMYLKELEIKNIISLLEGVRYQLNPQEILEFMIFV